MENYYLFALIFTLAYALTFLYFLRRFDADDPKIKAFKRVLMGVMGWALFDFLINRHFQHHSPQETLLAFRWLSCLFLFYPPASCELALTLIGRISRIERLIVYVPYACLYVAAIAIPSHVGGSTFGIPSLGLEYNEFWNQTFRIFTTIYVVFFLTVLMVKAVRIKDSIRRRELLIIFAGGVLTGLGIVAARQLMKIMGPDFPFMGSLSVVFTCAAAFVGTKLYGRVLSPRILYRATLKVSPSGMLRVKNDAVVWANGAMLKILGKNNPEALLGASLDNFIDHRAHPDLQGKWLTEQMSKGLLDNVEIALKREGGRPVWCLVSSALLDPDRPGLGTLVVFSDITALKEAEVQKIESEKLQAAIETAGAVCHEMNQPLQILSARLELMLMNAPDPEQTRQSLEVLQKQVERLGGITGRLITITKYRTKSYADGDDILDLDRSSEDVAS
jgi:PAS domain S-box-containing protein